MRRNKEIRTIMKLSEKLKALYNKFFSSSQLTDLEDLEKMNFSKLI